MENIIVANDRGKKSFEEGLPAYLLSLLGAQ
jgi:hypothetical protein